MVPSGHGSVPGRGLRPAFRAAILASLLAGWFLQIHACAHLKLAWKAAGLGGGRRASVSALLDLVRSSLRLSDWLAVGLLGLSMLAILCLEVRGRLLTGALRSALERRSGSTLFLVVIAAIAVRPYCDAGIPHAFDGKLHFAKLGAVSDLLRDGVWPSWTWRWYLGMPLLRFYGPSFYVPAAAGTLVGLSVAASLKLFLVLAHLAAGLGIFVLAKQVTGSRAAGTVAACAWLLALPPLHALLDLGRLPESVQYLTFPYLLLAVERFAASGRLRWAGATGAVLAVSLLAHPKLALLSAAVAAVFGATRLLCSPAHRHRPLAGILFGILSGGAALALAGFWLAPALSEIGAIRSGGGLRGELGLLVPDGFRPAVLLGLVNRFGIHSSLSSVSYVGWSVLFLACVGLWRLFRTRAGLALPLTLAGLLCLLYIGGSYFQSRCGAFLTVLLAVLAGAAFVETPRFPRLKVLALALLLLDLVPLGLVSPFRPDLEGVQEDLRALAPVVAGQKVVIVSLRTGRPELSQWTGWDDSGLAVLGGPFREAAGAVYSPAMAALAQLRADLDRGGRLNRMTVDALRTFGVAAVVFEDGTGLRAPPVKPADGYRIVPEPPAVLLEGSGPALFSTRLEPAPAELAARIAALPSLDDIPGPRDGDGWPRALDEVTGLLEPDPGAPRVHRILCRPTDLGAAAVTEERAGGAVSFTVRSANHLDVVFTASVPGAGYLHLPFAGYPGVVVKVDGFERKPMPTVQGMTAIPIGAGEHTVSVSGPRGLGAGRAGWISLCAVVLCVGALLRPRKPARPIA